MYSEVRKFSSRVVSAVSSQLTPRLLSMTAFLASNVSFAPQAPDTLPNDMAAVSNSTPIPGEVSCCREDIILRLRVAAEMLMGKVERKGREAIIVLVVKSCILNRTEDRG